MSYLLVGNETTRCDQRLTVLTSGSITLERGEFAARREPSDCDETAFWRAIALPHQRGAGMAFSDRARLPRRGVCDNVAPCFKPRGVLAAAI